MAKRPAIVFITRDGKPGDANYIELARTGTDYRLRYGREVKNHLDYGSAASELGLAIMDAAVRGAVSA